MKTRHHLKMKSHGGHNNRENIIYVDDRLHKAFHLLFRNMTCEEIAFELNQHWIDKKWTMVAVPTDIKVGNERHPVYAIPKPF